MEITALGDSALTIHVRNGFQSDPEGCLRDVARVLRCLQTANLPGVREITTAFTSASVFYDPVAVGAAEAFESLAEKITAITGHADPGPDGSVKANGAGGAFEIPVCYEGEFALDLAIVTAHTGLTEADVVAAHSGATYRVGCVGFAPGFPFLLGLPQELATPRRASPRTQVAAGSVAIGGAQTGIYPQQSPGGWNVIGRTPQRLFDAWRNPPALLAMGDTVRFRSISRAEFEVLSK